MVRQAVVVIHRTPAITVTTLRFSALLLKAAAEAIAFPILLENTTVRTADVAEVELLGLVLSAVVQIKDRNQETPAHTAMEMVGGLIPPQTITVEVRVAVVAQAVLEAIRLVGPVKMAVDTKGRVPQEGAVIVPL